ncbi:MAG: TolC family protein, partial [Thermoguttaceae bacterium]
MNSNQWRHNAGTRQLALLVQAVGAIVAQLFLPLGSVSVRAAENPQQLPYVIYAPGAMRNMVDVPPPALSSPQAVQPGATLAAPSAPDTVSLDQAIHETLHSDPKLRAALETITQARADLRTSGILPNPTLTVGGVLLPTRPLSPTRPGGPPEFDIIASYPIDWFLFGKRAAAMTNARLAVDVSAADYADQVRQRLAGTAAAFYDVLEAQATLNLAREDLDSLQRVETMTRRRVQLGGVGSIESDRMRLSVLDAQRETRNRETALATARAQLRAAMGRGIAAPPPEVAGSLDVPAPAPPLQVGEALAIAEQNRPDVVSLERQIAKARSGIAVEKTKAFPSVAPSAGSQYQYQTEIGSPNAAEYTATVNVTIPLFDRNQGNINKAESVLAQTYFNLQAQMIQVRAEIEQAVAEFQAARNDVTLVGPQQLQTARSVRDRTQAAYQAGGMSLLEVLDSERAYRDTYRTYIMGQSAY